MQGQVAKVAIDLAIVQGLSRALQHVGTQGKCLQVAIFCHLVHVQKIVDCGQAVECNQLLQLISWKRVADRVSLQCAHNTSPARQAELCGDALAHPGGTDVFIRRHCVQRKQPLAGFLIPRLDRLPGSMSLNQGISWVLQRAVTRLVLSQTFMLAFCPFKLFV